MIGIVIQARIGSTRLPNKIILPINNDENITFLDVLLTKITDNIKDIPVILATSTESENDILEGFSKKYNINFFRGAEHNVLKRFIDCAEEYSLKTIIRICSDNPYLDIEGLKKMIRNYNNEDYFSYKINNKPSILTHYGFFVEIVKVEALKKILKTNNSSCNEHVTNCIYQNTEHFSVNFIEKTISKNTIRCTLDTESDFENLKFIYNNWYKNNKTESYHSLLSFISENKTLENNMITQIKQNEK